MPSPIRLFKASSFHGGALAAHYGARPGLEGETFANQWKSLTRELLVGTDFWKEGLEEAGRFEVFETVINCAPLQSAWARENGVRAGTPKEILLAQIETYRPIVFFSHDFEMLDATFRSEVRRRVPSVQLIMGWDGIARCDAQFFGGCDLMLSCIPHVVEYYSSQNVQSKLLPYSFNDKILDIIPEVVCRNSVGFTGSIQLKSRLHFQRAEALYRAVRELRVDLHASGSVMKWKWRDREQRRRLRRLQFRQAWVTRVLGRANRGPLFGLPMYTFMASSGVILNMHIDAARGQASNMRLFEATGVGACLLTDWQSDLSDYFIPDVEVATYRNPREMVDKARHLMNSPLEREEIARAGQRRTLRDHTFGRRAEVLEGILREHL